MTYVYSQLPIIVITVIPLAYCPYLQFFHLFHSLYDLIVKSTKRLSWGRPKIQKHVKIQLPMFET